MTVGELYDALGEKLKTGEFNRFDEVVIADETGEAEHRFYLVDICTLFDTHIALIAGGDFSDSEPGE